MLKPLAFSAALAASLALSVPSALACDCAEPGSPEDSLQQASAVFEGTVAEVTQQDGSFTVTLLVERAWKGIESNPVTITTAGHGASCGLPFEQYEKYLVYAITLASESGEGDVLHATSCSRTKLSSQASADFDALGEGTKVELEGPGYFEPPGDGGPGDEPTPGDSKPKDDSGCALAPGNAKSSTASGLMLLLAALWFSRRRRF